MELLNKRYHIPLMLTLSLAAGAFLVWLASVSPGVEGGADSYNHYMIARWSWKYPHLLLDQWGKPIYTILASAFAQKGMMGLIVFNILLLIGSAWLVWGCALKLKIPNAWIAFIIALTSPIFLANTISGLTEPLSAFLLLLTIMLLIDDRYIAGAIMAGFLPYARSEGYVIMAVVGIYLVWRKEYRAFLFLLLGSVVLNVVGAIVLKDPIWVYHSNPYIKVQLDKENLSSCGRGAWLHYVRMTHYIFGRIAALLFAIGSVLVLVRFIRSPRELVYQKILFLLIGIFGLYYSVHAIIWKFGMMGSCGYERVMTVIAPLLAVVALIGFNSILKLVRYNTVRYLLTVIAVLIFIYTPYHWYHYKYPLEISKEQKMTAQVADWFTHSDYKDRLTYHLLSYFHVLSGIDPYDNEKHIDIWSFDDSNAPVGSIVIWDSHFGPNEGNVPLSLLQDHPDFREIKSFIPDEPFPTHNSDTYEIHVFERVGSSTLKTD